MRDPGAGMDGGWKAASRNAPQNTGALRCVMDDEGRASFSMEFSHFEPKRN